MPVKESSTHRAGAHTGTMRESMDLARVEGKNAVLEILRRNLVVRDVYLDEGAEEDEKVRQILSIAARRHIPVKKVDKRGLRGISHHRGANLSVIATVEMPRLPDTLSHVLRLCRSKGEEPFLVLLSQVDFRQNLGAILRTANAAGVHAVVVPRSRRGVVSADVIRVSMGAALFTPTIMSSLYPAIKTLKSEGVYVVGADMQAATPYHDADLRGGLALVLGGEHEGLPPPIRDRCDEVVSIPMSGMVSSLNLGAACSVLIYEKLRQDAREVQRARSRVRA